MEESKLRSNTGEAWSRCAQVLKEHDDGQVRAWKEEIDTLLVFAGLFSGVLTAFNVQFYALLQPDATTAQTAMLLHISMQLGNSNLNSGEVAQASRSHATSQLEMLALSATGTSVPMSAVRINVLVFASLVCSLAAASMAILVKQWLAQYTYGLSGTSRDSARLRQYRDDGLLRWKVAKIIMLLPMLLQVALLLFFAGLLEFLWTLHKTVALVSTVLVGMLVLFFAITLILPTISPDCPYQSAQAFGVFAMISIAKASLQIVCAFLRDRLDPWLLGSSMRAYWRAHTFQSLSKFIRDPTYYRWEDRERAYILNSTTRLDERTLNTVDRVLADDAFLESVISPCISDMAPGDALAVFKGAMARRAEYLQDGLATWHSNVGNRFMVTLSMMHVGLDMLVKIDEDDNPDRRRDVFRIVTSMWYSWQRPPVLQAATLARLRRLLEVLPSERFRWRDRYFLFLQIYETLNQAENPGDFSWEVTTALSSCLPSLQTASPEYKSNYLWCLFGVAQLLIKICVSWRISPSSDHPAIHTLAEIQEQVKSADWCSVPPLSRLRMLSMLTGSLSASAEKKIYIPPATFVQILADATINLEPPGESDQWITERASLEKALNTLRIAKRF